MKENNNEIIETLINDNLLKDESQNNNLNFLADEINAINIDEITPMEALRILYDIKKKYSI